MRGWAAARFVATLVPALLVGAGTASAAAAYVGANGAAPGAGPSVTSSIGQGAPGDVARLYGKGWPARTYVQATTCGNLAINGAADCAVGRSSSRITGADGTFVLDVVVATPPRPCPCVFHVISLASAARVDEPFEVLGQTSGALRRTAGTRALAVSTRLVRSGSVLDETTGRHTRTFTMTVRNTGTVAVVDPRVTLTFGGSANPTTILAQPRLGTIAPGASITYTYPRPISIGAFAAGTYTARAYFADLDEPLVVNARTQVRPWPAIVALAVLCAVGMASVYRRRRDRARRRNSQSLHSAPTVVA